MYIIYYFLDENKDPFYVGITKNLKNRKRRHLYNVKYGNTLPKYNKFRKVVKAGIDPKNIIVVQEKVATEDNAIQREIYLIAKLKNQGYKLYNLTEGGKGSLTFSYKLHKKMAKKRIGKKHSKETKKRISESRIGMKFSDEHKANLSKARKKRIITKETREKASKTSKGKINIKSYKLTDLNGKIYVTKNGLVLFCKQYNLSRTEIYKVLNGKKPNYKGWKIERIKDDN